MASGPIVLRYLKFAVLSTTTREVTPRTYVVQTGLLARRLKAEKHPKTMYSTGDLGYLGGFWADAATALSANNVATLESERRRKDDVLYGLLEKKLCARRDSNSRPSGFRHRRTLSSWRHIRQQALEFLPALTGLQKSLAPHRVCPRRKVFLTD